MNTSNPAEMPWWDEFIEDYVDGTLALEKASRIDALRASDASLAAQIELAQAMQSQFRSTVQPVCPDHVIRRVVTEVRTDLVRHATSTATRTVSDFLSRQLRPIAAMLTLIAIVVVSAQVGVPSRTDPAVADALVEVKWTLAYLSEVTRETGTTVRMEALEPLLLNPMTQVVDSFIDD